MFVTPEGEVLRGREGVVSRPASAWARAALHRTARDRCAVLDAQCAELAGHDETARTALAAVQRRVRAAERSAGRAQAARDAAAAAAGRVAAQHAEALALRDVAQRELEQEADAGPAAQAAVEAAEAALAQAQVLAGELEAQAQPLRAALTEAETRSTAARAELAAARVGDAEAAERLAAIQRRAASRDHIVDLSLPSRALQALVDAAEAVAHHTRRVAGDAHGATEAVTGAQQERQTHRQRVVEAEAAVESARQLAHEAELAVAAAAARADELGAPPAEDVGQVDPEAVRREVAELEQRRRSLGAVNPLAAEEHAEVGGRVAEIDEQITDLQATAEALHGHMRGLETIVNDGFDELFAAVRSRFADNIATLFPGGQGRLVEVDTDAEEPGIEVQVVPAGKRARPLAMLSGGERSLVALAFCMAIAMTSPAPFYLLDEVEAALDDSNLRRFLALVRKLSDHTQFLLITHQQPTVEIADTLFGVTMAGDGVSQVVCRRLEHALEGGARPFVRRQLHAIRGGRA
ncbi:MAG: AAA family ATPase [Thermoleophilia bacterium]